MPHPATKHQHKRPLHVLDVSVPTLAGYTTRSRYIANAQAELGLEPVVVTSVRQENTRGVDREEIDGIPYYRTRPPGDNGKPAAVTAEIHRLRRRIVEVARAERPDVIHAHSSILCGIPGLLAARQIGLPCIYEIRSFWEDAAVDLGRTRVGSRRYRLTRAAETALARSVDGLVTICQGMADDLVERGIDHERICIVPNGVDTQRFTPLQRDEALAERLGVSGKTVVAYIGTFYPFEGVPSLVQALVSLIESGRDDVRGLIVGHGRTYDECRDIAAAAGLSEKIVHPGRVPHEEVQSYYSISDVLVYPRTRQRITELVTPLKPLEAMAMEKAVIASDVGGLRELVTHESNGLLYRAEDPTALEDAIVRLATDHGFRNELGRGARTHVSEQRQWRRIVERHVPLYASARDRRDTRRALWGATARLFGNSLN